MAFIIYLVIGKLMIKRNQTKINHKPQRRALSARMVIYNTWFYQLDSFLREYVDNPEITTMDDLPVFHDKVKGEYIDVRSMLKFNIDFFTIINNHIEPSKRIDLESLIDLYNHFSFDTLDDLQELSLETLESLLPLLRELTKSLNHISLTSASDIILTLRIKDFTDKLQDH